MHPGLIPYPGSWACLALTAKLIQQAIQRRIKLQKQPIARPVDLNKGQDAVYGVKGGHGETP